MIVSKVIFAFHVLLNREKYRLRARDADPHNRAGTNPLKILDYFEFDYVFDVNDVLL